MLPSLLSVPANLLEHSPHPASASSPLTHASPNTASFLAPGPPSLLQTVLAPVSKDLQLVRASGHVPVLLWDLSATHDTASIDSLLPWAFPSCSQSRTVFSHTSVGSFLPAPRLTAFPPFHAILSSLTNPRVFIPRVQGPPTNLLVSP